MLSKSLTFSNRQKLKGVGCRCKTGTAKIFYLYPKYLFMFWKIIIPILLFLAACQSDLPMAEDTKETEMPDFATRSGNLGLLHQMQGRWKDSRIKGAELLVTGNKFVTIYQDEIRNTATIEVYQKCPKFCRNKSKGKGIGYFIVHRDDGDFCFVLQALDHGVLEYAPLE